MSRYLLVPVDRGSNKSVILPKDIFKNYGICCTSDGLVQCGEEKFDIKFDDFVKDFTEENFLLSLIVFILDLFSKKGVFK